MARAVLLQIITDAQAGQANFIRNLPELLLPAVLQLPDCRDLESNTERLYLSAIFVKLMFPCIESPARLEDSLEVTPVAIQNQCRSEEHTSELQSH